MESMAILMMLLGVILVVMHCAHRAIEASRSWSDGFEEHARLMQLYEMSPDDDALLGELQTALKSHIKTAGLYRKGDSGRIDKTSDWYEFKNLAWELTVHRREQEGR